MSFNIEVLNSITKTVEGYEVKNLRYKPLDNIITGFVKCPIIGRENLHNGFVTCVWLTNGSTHSRYGGTKRKDLYIKIKH